MAHAHGTLYRERGLLTSAGKEIKSREEILSLWEVVWLPKRMTIVLCKGHQKGDSPGGRGNRLTDLVTWGVSLEQVGPLHILVPLPKKFPNRLKPRSFRAWFTGPPGTQECPLG